ncbi:MAG TPA: alpha-E domain-containing protein [Ureibacillus sp.]|nr:alpha-E domain-containing protein [Ureibacillus sp.]
MLSRVADSLYWIGRYCERTETNAHILTTRLDHMIELSREDSNYRFEWEAIIKICGYFNDFKNKHDGYYLKKMIRYLLCDNENLNSITSMVESYRMNARNTRDLLPNELWEEWNDLYLSIKEKDKEETSIISTYDFLSNIRKSSLTASGIIDSLMTRDECYLFLKIGKWIERAEKTAIIINELLEYEEQFTDDFIATYSLQLTHSFEEYTRRSRNRSKQKVLNFLVGDLKCSRSIAHSIHKIKEAILEVENGKIEVYAVEMFEALAKLEDILQVDTSSLTQEACKEWVKDIRDQCTNFGPIFSKTYYLTPPILVT